MSQFRPDTLTLDHRAVRAPPSESPDAPPPAAFAPLMRRRRGSGELIRHPPPLPLTGGQVRVAGFGSDETFCPNDPEVIISGDFDRNVRRVFRSPESGEMEKRSIPEGLHNRDPRLASNGRTTLGAGEAETAAGGARGGHISLATPTADGPLRHLVEPIHSCQSSVGSELTTSTINSRPNVKDPGGDSSMHGDSDAGGGGGGGGGNVNSGIVRTRGNGVSNVVSVASPQDLASVRGVPSGCYSVGGEAWWTHESDDSGEGVGDEGSSLITDWSASEKSPRILGRGPEGDAGGGPSPAIVGIGGSVASPANTGDDERSPPSERYAHYAGVSESVRRRMATLGRGTMTVQENSAVESESAATATVVIAGRPLSETRVVRSTPDLEHYQPPSLLRQPSRYSSDNLAEAKRLQSQRVRAQRHKRLSFADEHGEPLHDTNYLQGLYYSKEGVPTPRRNGICCSIS